MEHQDCLNSRMYTTSQIWEQTIWCQSLTVITKSWRLRDYSRWVFRKNSMEFSIGLNYLLILLYKWLYTTSPQSHVLLECSMITCPSHVIWLHKFPCYLYLVFIVWLDICDQVFEHMGNFLLLGALITLTWSKRDILSTLGQTYMRSQKLDQLLEEPKIERDCGS